MSYIRERSELRTGYQENGHWLPEIDFQCDFVMVYGIDATMPERIHEFHEKGYVVHLMTGCSWGEYEDYLSGEWDGREHWDESQISKIDDEQVRVIGSCARILQLDCDDNHFMLRMKAPDSIRAYVRIRL